MTPADIILFALGWTSGWLLLWREHPLPPARAPGAGGPVREPIAVIVPARDEGRALPHLVGVVAAQLRPGDEFVVVDDHSTDDTSEIATRYGARVTAAPPLAEGWLGKPHACRHGVSSTAAPTLLFLDADVRPAPDLLDRIGSVVEVHPDRIVSVQPWHHTAGWREQASILCNVTALMGSAAFTVVGRRIRPDVAFGPVLAVRRETYNRIGGHAVVRSMHTEDIGLARAAGTADLFTGRPDTSFRMYPDGLGQAVAGWTRSIATGARSTRWWIALATMAWMAALAGGWLASGVPPADPIGFGVVYALCAVQVLVLGRRAGAMHPVTAALYPLAVAVFVVIFVRSLAMIVLRRDVTWKGRRVDARQS